MRVPAASSGGGRLVWLDVTRFLSALMILGIHWLRACFNVGLFGANDGASSIVMNYQGHTGGLQLFHHVLIAGTGWSASTWLTNAIGLLGGFGWEAVSVLIVISGFSLGISQRSRNHDVPQWLRWYGRRARRILVPFYIVASIFLGLYACALLALTRLHGPMADAIGAKMISQFHTPLLGVLLSHTLLFDPYNRFGDADFLAPAWWFVPAILVAYAVYPLVQTAIRSRLGGAFLGAAALLSVASFAATDAGVLVNEQWYYIVLQESFDFTLGIFLAKVWLGPHRPLLERSIRKPAVFVAALMLFVAGNIANWSSELRPIAGLLYGPSLTLILVSIGTSLARLPVSRLMARVDAYDLYLVHQPFAFPLALIVGRLVHGYAVFAGWFVFVAVALLGAKALTWVRDLPSRPRPRARGPAIPVPLFAASRRRVG